MYKSEDLYRVMRVKDPSSLSMEQYAFSHFFSYSNICQVCFSHERDIRLKRCTRCKMVYYCGKEHQKVHWSTHKDFCAVATKLLKKFGGLNLFDKMNTENERARIDWKNWLVDTFETDLKRKLIPHEKSLIFFPKLCAVCYENDPSRLIFCRKCPHASFCKEHFGDESHVKICHLFSQELIWNGISITFKAAPIPGVIESIPYNKTNVSLPSSLQDFLNDYCKCKKSSLMHFHRSEIQVYMSEHLTRPLTLLYALEKLRYPKQQNMTIHVIGANNFEEVGFKTWEVLLHWLPDLLKLRIILIGPECTTASQQVSLCKVCNGNSKTLLVESQGSLYKDYLKSRNSAKPSLIVAFNAGLKNYDTWKESLIFLSKFQCPFILTTCWESEIHIDHEIMLQTFGHFARYTYREINPFASLRPYRDVVKTDVFFRNTGVLMYTKLWQKEVQMSVTRFLSNQKKDDVKQSCQEKFVSKENSVVPVKTIVNHPQINRKQGSQEENCRFYCVLTFYLIFFIILILYHLF